MPLMYRRVRGSDTWHFREDCAYWPETGFEQEMHTPNSGVCCVECTYWPPSLRSRSGWQPQSRPTDHRDPTRLAGY